jgi:hypothetical protein
MALLVIREAERSPAPPTGPSPPVERPPAAADPAALVGTG